MTSETPPNGNAAQTGQSRGAVTSILGKLSDSVDTGSATSFHLSVCRRLLKESLDASAGGEALSPLDPMR